MFEYQRIDLTEVQQGVDFELSLVIGPLLDMTGCTVKSQVRKYANDPTLALAFDVTVVGQYLLLRKPASQMKLAPRWYVWDAKITTLDGREHIFFGGKFEVVNVVTK